MSRLRAEIGPVRRPSGDMARPLVPLMAFPKGQVRFFVSRENLRGVSISTRPTMPTKKKAKDDEKRAMGIPRAVPCRVAQRYVRKVTPLKNGKVRESRHPISLQFELQRCGVLHSAGALGPCDKPALVDRMLMLVIAYLML